jgi:uncharacterized membrane protein YeiH
MSLRRAASPATAIVIRVEIREPGFGCSDRWCRVQHSESAVREAVFQYAGWMPSTLLLVLDLVGIGVFAVAGALAAVAVGFDLFGVVTVAVVNAIGGGMVRDALLGATPAAALTDWRYLAVPLLCALVVSVAHPALARAAETIVVIDALGLGIFAAAGTQKALRFELWPLGAVALGVVTAVGGGVIRDVLTREVPAVLHRDVYALAALLGAFVVVLGDRFGWRPTPVTLASIVLTWGVRVVAHRRGWSAPQPRGSSPR